MGFHRHRFSHFRSLALQLLEPRHALAVTGTVIDGDLFLTGDSADDNLRIDRGGSTLRVFQGPSGNETFTLYSGVTGDIIVSLGAGNDSIEFREFAYAGSLIVNLGAGNDSMTVSSGSIEAGNLPPYHLPGSVVVSGRDGNDTLTIRRVDIAGDVLFYGGDGNDTLNVVAESFPPTIAGHLTADLATGDDVVNMSNIGVGSVRIVDPIGTTTGSHVTMFNVGATDTVEMFLSIGDDVVDIDGNSSGIGGAAATAYNLSIHTGLGNDRVDVEHMAMVNLALYTGDGDEGNGFFGVNLKNLTIFGELLVDTGAGFDNVLIDQVQAVSLNISGGTGSDGIIVQNVTAQDAVFKTYDLGDVLGLHQSSYSGALSLDLGDGDDSLYASNLHVVGLASFEGGLGVNTFNDLGGNTFGQLVKSHI